MAAYRSSTYLAGASPARRGASALLALGIALLLILALLRLGGIRPGEPGDGRPLSTFDIAPEGRSERTASRERVAQERQAARRTAPVPDKVDTPPPPRPAERPPLPPPPIRLPGVMVLSGADFAAADVSRIPRAARAGPPAGEGAADGDSKATYGPGAGPGGEPLYEAEWYREPTPAETQPYMPAGRTGWGLIACQTIDRYHVENCRELGETPGSGIARGLRQAAWQFLVRPPRKGGKPLIGAWVRIRFDVTARPAE